MQPPDFSQNFNRYSYALNNPFRYTDPNGEFWQYIVGAILGGSINLVANWGNIQNFGQGLSYFAMGAVGGVLMATGSPMSIAAAGTKGPNVNHYHLNSGSKHYTPSQSDPGFKINIKK